MKAFIKKGMKSGLGLGLGLGLSSVLKEERTHAGKNPTIRHVLGCKEVPEPVSPGAPEPQLPVPAFYVQSGCWSSGKPLQLPRPEFKNPYQTPPPPPHRAAIGPPWPELGHIIPWKPRKGWGWCGAEEPRIYQDSLEWRHNSRPRAGPSRD